jgi:hypothetical protein
MQPFGETTLFEKPGFERLQLLIQQIILNPGMRNWR